MEKVDVKDKKILYYLGLDSRQSLRQIGRNVGLTKEVVGYRIKRLQELGVIENFFTAMQLTPLGIKLYVRFNLNFQNINPNIKQEIIQFFIKYNDSLIVSSLEGSYDLIVIIVAPDLYKIYSFLEVLQTRYGDYFKDRHAAIYLNRKQYNASFLLSKRTKKVEPHFHRDCKMVEFDALDLGILRYLDINARMPITELADKLDSTVTVMHYRIKRLLRQNVILGFGVNIDWSKLGYRYYHVEINLKKYTMRPEIIRYLLENPHLRCTHKLLGYASDLEVDFILENVTQLHEVMDDLSQHFPDSVKDFKYCSLLKVHKEVSIPQHD